MGSEKAHGPIFSASRVESRQPAVNEMAGANETAADDLGALALFGSEAASSIEAPAVGGEQREQYVPVPSHDPVRTLRTRLAADSRSSGFHLVSSRAAALKVAVGDYASNVRSLLRSKFREYLVRHPKLPAQTGLVACIVVASVAVGHYVGRIDVVSIAEVPPQSSARAAVASEPLTGSPVAAPVPAAPVVQRQPADRQTDVRAQLPPALKTPAPNAQAPTSQAPKPLRSTVDVAASNSPSRRAENPGRRIGRETPRTERTGAADSIIAPPSSVPPAVPLVAASARPTAALSAPVSPVQPVTRNNADDESSAPIYSAQDVDVRPPQMLEANLPRPAVMNWPTVKNSMELVVTEDGTVQHVKWLTSRERMPDVMLLSRAKLWKFSPALRDGRPVRYRLVVTWEVNP